MWRLWLLTVLVLGLVVAAMTLPAPADQALSGWKYPFECCSDRDCAEVEKAELITDSKGNSVLQVTTKFGTMTVDQNTKRYESKDNKLHACIWRYFDGRPRVNCIFYPPGT